MAKPKPEYHEGPEALERFNKMMTQVFRAPKLSTPFTKPKPKRKRRTASKD
jgi:hypothetical protein